MKILRYKKKKRLKFPIPISMMFEIPCIKLLKVKMFKYKKKK